MEEKSFLNNFLNSDENEIKSKKIVLKYPKCISNRELFKNQIRLKNELYEINKENFFLQNSSIFKEVKRKSLDKLFKDVEKLNNSTKNDNKKDLNKNIDILMKKQLIKKIKNKRTLIPTNNSRKILENKTKFIPSFLLDFIHPYEYLFNQKNIESRNKNRQLKLHLTDLNFNSVNNINLLTSYNNKSSKNNISPIKAKHKVSKKIYNNIYVTDVANIKASRSRKYCKSPNNNDNRARNTFKKYSQIQKYFLRNITDINDNLNNIKTEIMSENENTNRNIKLNENKEKKLDKILSSLSSIKKIEPNNNSDINIIKHLFKQIKKKNHFNELTRQYSTYNKRISKNSFKKKLVNELIKLNIIEKNEILLSNMQYKENYELKKEINKLEENNMSKERKIFNYKITKMKNMNIKNIEYFRKNINKLKLKK